MRDAAEIQEMESAQLRGMLTRPGMYGGGRGFEDLVRRQIHTVAFIDRRDDELGSRLKALSTQGWFGPAGVWGTLTSMLGPDDYTDELASIYAELAARLGYFQPERRLPEATWSDLQSVTAWASERPRYAADIESRFGPPSYRNSSSNPRVFSYAGPADGGWLHFDLADHEPLTLRDIRLPGLPAADAIIDLRKRDKASSDPEETYRRFLVASLSGDEDAVRALIIPPVDPADLWAGAYPGDVATALAGHYRSMQVMRVPAPDDTTYLVSDGCPVPLRLIRQSGGWRIDPEALIRFMSGHDSSGAPRTRH